MHGRQLSEFFLWGGKAQDPIVGALILDLDQSTSQYVFLGWEETEEPPT